ncbi:MAG: GspE/PulE family protein [Candidatus Colwellbacteria bacterium]
MLKFSQQPIDEKLQSLQRDAEERDAMRRAKEEGHPYLDLDQQVIDRSAVELVPEALAKEGRVVVFAKDKDKVKIGAYSSTTSEFEKIKLLLDEKKLSAEIFIVSSRSLNNAWQHYAAIRPEDQEEIVSEIALSEGVILSKENIKTIEAASEDLSIIDNETATTDVLIKILADAIVLKASDIHLEPSRESSQIRYRIDGVLYEVGRFEENVGRRVVGRLKLLANLKLNIKDEAQDGRFTIRRPGGKDVEVRISVVPSEFGEAIVMRVLDPSAVDIDIGGLGLRKDDLEIVERHLKGANGMILATGPTGSGKTTTLYAFLKHKRSSEAKTITIEDPIEYHLEGIEQTQVRPKENYTFASGLRSILRQDPDMILVGEIRDAETATTAIDAALTGHLVFSTLHTNNAPGAIPRLIDLKSKISSLASALKLVVAQRLVRKLCEKCKQPLEVENELKAKIEAFKSSLPERASPPESSALYKNVGCPSCINGFQGRMGIFELLTFNESVVEALDKKVSELDVRRVARSEGMVYMQEDGVIKALEGVTTLEEVEKVTGPINWPASFVE